MSDTAPPFGPDVRRIALGEVAGSEAGQNGNILPFTIDVWPDQSYTGHPNLHAPAETLALLKRILDNHATLQLRCAALEAEKATFERSQRSELHDALERVHELEATLEDLMSVVARYEDLLYESDLLLRQAEARAVDADHRIRKAEHGTAEAVEWLYRYMTVPPTQPEVEGSRRIDD